MRIFMKILFILFIITIGVITSRRYIIQQIQEPDTYHTIKKGMNIGNISSQLANNMRHSKFIFNSSDKTLDIYNKDF